MCSGAGHTTGLVRGSPIRTSSDQRSVDSSPRLIAASYVLHRLLVPRHPPCALNNLATQKTPHTHPRKETAVRAYKNSSTNKESKDARVHCAVLNVQPDTPHTPPPNPRTPRGTRRYEKQGGPEQKQRPPGQTPGPVPSGPNSVPTTNPPSTTPFHTPPQGAPYWEPATAGGRTGQRSTLEHHPTRPAGTRRWAPITVWARLCTTPRREAVTCSLERR